MLKNHLMPSNSCINSTVSGRVCSEQVSALAHEDSFQKDRHPELKADHMPAGPLFNNDDWRGELLNDETRWRLGAPPVVSFKNITNEIPRVSST